MDLAGELVEIKSRIDAASDVVQRIVLVVHGDMAELQSFMQKPLRIQITELDKQ